jgi:formate dehydrogenase major subunit
LAKEKGIKSGHWVEVWSKRGSVKAKAVVTKRIVPLICDGKTVHIIGIPLHWGFIGETKEGFGPNSLTPYVGDANYETPEFKAFLVNIKPIAGPDVVALDEGTDARGGDFPSLIADTLGDRSRTDF